MLRAKDTLLLVVDFQGKLPRIVQDSPAVLDAAGRLICAARVLEVPTPARSRTPRASAPPCRNWPSRSRPRGGRCRSSISVAAADPGIRQAMKDTGCKQVPAGRDRVARVRLPNRLLDLAPPATTFTWPLTPCPRGRKPTDRSALPRPRPRGRS